MVISTDAFGPRSCLLRSGFRAALCYSETLLDQEIPKRK